MIYKLIKAEQISVSVSFIFPLQSLNLSMLSMQTQIVQINLVFTLFTTQFIAFVAWLRATQMGCVCVWGGCGCGCHVLEMNEL